MKLQIFIIMTLFLSKLSFAEEIDFNDISEQLSEATTELKQELILLGESDLNEAIVFDNALDNLSEVMEFIDEGIAEENIDQTLATIKFLEESLNKISEIIPDETYRDMSDLQLDTFSDEDLLVIKNISDEMNKNKDIQYKEIITNLIELEGHGLSAFDVVNDLSNMGVNIIDIKANLKSAETMKQWSLEDWANSWSGETANQSVENIQNDDGTWSRVTTALSENEVLEMKATLAMNFASEGGFDARDFNSDLTTSFDDKLINLSGIDKDAAYKAISNLNKSEEEWASSWTGEMSGVSSINGKLVPMTDEEIQATKAEWAKNRAIQSIINNAEYDEVSNINVKELREVAKSYRTVTISEPEFDAGFNQRAAQLAISQLNKSEEEWASSWIGDEPGVSRVCTPDGCTNVQLSAEEIQATKAEWAKNAGISSMLAGKKNDSLNISMDELSKASELASADMQKQIAAAASNAAAQAEETSESIKNIVSEGPSGISEVIKNSETLNVVISKEHINDIASLEKELSIDIEALVEDTSSWTEAEWAASWIGDEPGVSRVCTPDGCTNVQLSAEEIQATKAEWAKNKSDQMKN